MPNPVYMPGSPEDREQRENALDRPGIMETFRTRVDKFWNVYTDLESKQGQVPDKLQSEYSDLMERGGRIRATIETLTNTYDAAAEWISDVFGFSGVDGLDKFRWSDLRGANLGAVPFVPIAVITGASAMIIKWLKDAYTFERKITEYNRLQDQGYDAERAAEIVQKTVSGPGFFNLRANMKPLIIIAVAGGGLWYANRKGWI